MVSPGIYTVIFIEGQIKPHTDEQEELLLRNNGRRNRNTLLASQQKRKAETVSGHSRHGKDPYPTDF